MAPKGIETVELTTSNRKAVFAMLLGSVEGGELKHGIKKKVATIFEVAPQTVGRIFESTLSKIEFFYSANDMFEEQLDLANLKVPWSVLPMEVFASDKGKGTGNNKSLDREELKERTRLVPLNKKKTYRSLARQIGVSYSSVFRMLRKEKIFRRHVNKLKPKLTPENEWLRFEFALDKINVSTIIRPTRTGWTFNNLNDEVHIDEKWFFLCEEGARYILVSDEKDPYRSVKHKSHIAKVMFICAMARPRQIAATKTMWDGKIGIWPVGYWSLAKRDSVNRKKGTPEWQDLSINAEVYQDLLLEKIVPAVIEKWPRDEWNNDHITIKLQQDGAKAHTEKSVATSTIWDSFVLSSQSTTKKHLAMLENSSPWWRILLPVIPRKRSTEFG
jgi:hypothetical protein